MTNDLTPLDETQRTEQFREFVSGQMRRQTRSLDTISTLIIVWFVLTLLGGLVLVIASAVAGSGY